MTRKSTIMVLGTLLGLYASSQASAAADQVVIGDIDDMSGVYADVMGQAGVDVINMAIADFGGTVLGKKITVLSVDHQNKPDIGASKFREWADQNGLTVVLGGSNTGVSIAMSKVAAAKKIPFIAIGAGGASLTGADCTPYTVHYAYDTTALGNGNHRLFIVPASGTGVRGASLGVGERGYRFLEFAQGGQRIRHYENHEARGAAGLSH
jgi:branched-chain amino acid transport system substrate-binding protein